MAPSDGETYACVSYVFSFPSHHVASVRRFGGRGYRRVGASKATQFAPIRGRETALPETFHQDSRDGRLVIERLDFAIIANTSPDVRLGLLYFWFWPAWKFQGSCMTPTMAT